MGISAVEQIRSALSKHRLSGPTIFRVSCAVWGTSELDSVSRHMDMLQTVEYDRCEQIRTLLTDYLGKLNGTDEQKIQKVAELFKDWDPEMRHELLRGVISTDKDSGKNLVEKQTLPDKAPEQQELTKKDPAPQKVAVKAPEQEKVIVKAPVQDKATVKAPELEKATVKAPVQEKATVKAPELEKATVKAPVQDTATVKAPVQEKVTVKAPAQENSTEKESTKPKETEKEPTKATKA